MYHYIVHAQTVMNAVRESLRADTVCDSLEVLCHQYPVYLSNSSCKKERVQQAVGGGGGGAGGGHSSSSGTHTWMMKEGDPADSWVSSREAEGREKES